MPGCLPLGREVHLPRQGSLSVQRKHCSLLPSLRYFTEVRGHKLECLQGPHRCKIGLRPQKGMMGIEAKLSYGLFLLSTADCSHVGMPVPNPSVFKGGMKLGFQCESPQSQHKQLAFGFGFLFSFEETATCTT